MPILHWLIKDEAITAAKRSAYRLLEEVPKLSYGDADNKNLLILGDNLEALRALIPFYAGKVKCIYIDPPYNTKSAFEHYDDGHFGCSTPALTAPLCIASTHQLLELKPYAVTRQGCHWSHHLRAPSPRANTTLPSDREALPRPD